MLFYICGDLNIYMEETEKTHVKKFNSILNRHALAELVQTETRGKARLDLIISHDENT